MTSGWIMRVADQHDVAAVCRFGHDFVADHYAPLIGASAAEAQVRAWWNDTHIGAAVHDGLVVIAEEAGQVVGVGQRGAWEGAQVVWKLYVHPEHRGHGLGPRLIQELITQLPRDADQLYLEHFAGNLRAASFYEREGFSVDRIEPSSTGDGALDTVWRVRSLAV